MHRTTGWTFYGREGCDCCTTAAGFLMAVVHGNKLTLRMEDVPPHHRDHAPGLPRSIPALVDPAGKVVWQGSFDSEATRMALEAWGVAPLVEHADASHAAA